LRAHPLIGEPLCALGVGGLARHEGRSVGAADREPLPVLAERGRGALDAQFQLAFGQAEQDAELVAAHSVGDPVAGEVKEEVVCEAL